MAQVDVKKILVVDDSNTILNILKKDLIEIGVKDYAFAEDGMAALDLLEIASKNTAFDIVLCDWIMPNLSGIELLRKVRSHENKKVSQVRFIMITGTAEKVKEAMDEGADNYLAKPFTADDLKEKLEFVLR